MKAYCTKNQKLSIKHRENDLNTTIQKSYNWSTELHGPYISIYT